MKAERLVFLPHERGAEPALALTADQVAHRVPAPSTLAAAGSARMLAGEAEQIVPLAGLAQLDQGQASQATIGDERTLGLAQRRDHAI